MSGYPKLQFNYLSEFILQTSLQRENHCSTRNRKSERTYPSNSIEQRYVRKIFSVINFIVKVTQYIASPFIAKLNYLHSAIFECFEVVVCYLIGFTDAWIFHFVCLMSSITRLKLSHLIFVKQPF